MNETLVVPAISFNAQGPQGMFWLGFFVGIIVCLIWKFGIVWYNNYNGG